MAGSDLDNPGVKAVITLGVLGFVAICAFAIAKLVQYCVNKHYTDDGGGHIDENTRALIRARLSVVQFKKREIQKAKRETTFDIFKKWKDFVKSKKNDREKALKSQRPQGNGQVVISIDKLDECNVKENGVLENESNKIQENGTPRIQRFPSFAQTKTSGGGVKPNSETPRITPLTRTNVVKPEVPVPRGRPVSSKQRTLPNVTVKHSDVTGSTKILVKSVHFENDTEKVETKIKTDNGNDKTSHETEKKDKVKVDVNTDEEVTVTENKDNGKKVGTNTAEKISYIDETVSLKTKTETEKSDQINNNVKNVETSTNKDNKDGAKTNTIKTNNVNSVDNADITNKEKVTADTVVENKSGEKT